MQVVKNARNEARKWLKKGFLPTQLCADHFLKVTDRITRKQSEALNEIQAEIGKMPLPKGKKGLTKALGWQCMASVYVLGNMVGIDLLMPDTYICLPKKQGKTSYAAALALVIMKFCPDVSPQVFSIATKRDQANLVLEDGRRSIRQRFAITSKGYLRGDWVDKREFLGYAPNMGEWRALSSEARTLDGIFPNFTLFDEAALVTDDVYAVVDVATNEAASWQGKLAISTANYNVDGWFGTQLRDAIHAIEDGETPDFNVLAWMPPEDRKTGACLLSEEEKEDPRTWERLCPSWGVTCSVHSTLGTSARQSS